MQITVKHTSLEENWPNLNEYVETRFRNLEKLLKHWDEEGALDLKVELARTTKHHSKGDVYYAEANLELPGKVLRAEATLHDIRAAIDEVYEDLRLQVEKYRDSRLTKIRRGARFLKKLFRGE